MKLRYLAVAAFTVMTVILTSGEPTVGRPPVDTLRLIMDIPLYHDGDQVWIEPNKKIQCSAPLVSKGSIRGEVVSSTSTLAGFPMKSQFADTNEVNRLYDCVPTSIAAALQWLLKKPYSGAQIKDAVYGPSYVGGTDPSSYVDYCASQGVTLWPISNSDTNALVQTVHEQLALQHPVLITEPNPYNNVPGDTHALVAYQDDVNEFTAMDPAIAAPVSHSNATWASLLQFGQVWPLAMKQNPKETIIRSQREQANTVSVQI